MKFLKPFIQWSTTILVPLALISLGIRIVLTHTFLNVEYRTPNFPADSYGFNLADRLKWAGYSWDYLLNDQGISYLGDLTFSDGKPLFNEREVSHMQDVKHVVKPALQVGLLAWIGLAILWVLAIYRKMQDVFYRGLRWGGWVMTSLLGVVGVFAIASFWNFFEVFHSLFFKGDSWLFLYSDTLIRLFPLRFWEDTFGFVGVFALAGGLGLALGLKPGKKMGVKK